MLTAKDFAIELLNIGGGGLAQGAIDADDININY